MARDHDRSTSFRLDWRDSARACARQFEQFVWALKFDSNQPRAPAGQSDGGQWVSVGRDSAPSTDRSVGPSPQDIIARAKRLNLAGSRSGYQRCLDLCYPLLERPQKLGSDRNQWDFHKCMNACLGRNL